MTWGWRWPNTSSVKHSSASYSRKWRKPIPGVTVVDPAPVLCDDAGLCRAELDGHSLYTDDNHLSEVGARFIAPVLEPLFKRLQARATLGNGNPNAAK